MIKYPIDDVTDLESLKRCRFPAAIWFSVLGSVIHRGKFKVRVNDVKKNIVFRCNFSFVLPSSIVSHLGHGNREFLRRPYIDS